MSKVPDVVQYMTKLIVLCIPKQVLVMGQEEGTTLPVS